MAAHPASVNFDFTRQAKPYPGFRDVPDLHRNHSYLKCLTSGFGSEKGSGSANMRIAAASWTRRPELIWTAM